MKNSISTIVASLVILCISSPALAEEGGNSGGGGGFVVTCTQEKNVPYVTQLADLWLAKNGRGPFRQIGKQQIITASNSESVDSIIQRVIKRAKSVNVNYGTNLELMVREVTRQVEFVTNENIVAENDTDIVSVPKNCAVAGVARYSDIEDFLTVATEPYSELSNLDKAALTIHEAIYKIKRGMTKSKITSYSTQLEVGLLFSNSPLKGVDLTLLESPYLCSSLNGGFSSFVVGIEQILGGGVSRFSFVHQRDLESSGTFTISPTAYGIGSKISEMKAGAKDMFEVYREAVAMNKVSELMTNSKVGWDGEKFTCHKLK